MDRQIELLKQDNHGAVLLVKRTEFESGFFPQKERLQKLLLTS
jgi:hypothetical protein